MSPSVPLQIVIASIMCSYNKEDWTELAKMAEVRVTVVKTAAVRYTCYRLAVNQCYLLQLYFAISRRYSCFYNQDVYYMENNIPETFQDCRGKNLQRQSSHKLTNMNESWFYS